MSVGFSQLQPLYHNVNVSFNSVSGPGNASVHYVEAGAPHLPTVLLMHGFPSSGSVEYRDLIPLLADSYHVYAPDFPGFGLTHVQSPNFTYTFDNLASVIESWASAVDLGDFAMYIHDYGAPVGLRLALSRPSQVKAIVSQNGNAYVEGFGQEFWGPIFNLWNSSNSEAARQKVAENVLTLAATEEQYTVGTPQRDMSLLDPQVWNFNYLQNLQGKTNVQHQLDLFYDYRTNVALYPKFQQYFRESGVPILAVWGKGDPAFIPAGAKAFKKDSPSAVVRFVDASHFALETKRWEIARIMRHFLTSVGF